MGIALNRIRSNIASLGLLQVANFVIPLLVIPVLTRVLGTETFGRVSYAQNIITYLTLLVNYGFEYSATRQIAISEGDKPQQERIFWSTLASKVILLLISFIALMGLMFSSQRVAEDGLLYVYTALINIGVVLFPTWYLQGVQDMKKMAWFNLAIKTLGAVLVVSIIQRADQYRLYPLFLSLSSIAVGTGALIYVVKHYTLRIPPLVWEDLVDVLRPGGMIFINQVFISLYTTVNFTLLGLYLSDSSLGIFSGAQRIILAANSCLVVPISTALFPEISRLYTSDKERSRRLFRRTLLGSAVLSALASLLIYLLAPWIVRLFLGSSFVEAIDPLRRMSPIPFLVMLATILTVQGMYGRGLQQYSPLVGLVLATLCISLNIYLIPRIGMNGAIVAWIASEVCEIVLVSVILYRHRPCSIS